MHDIWKANSRSPFRPSSILTYVKKKRSKEATYEVSSLVKLSSLMRNVSVADAEFHSFEE